MTAKENLDHRLAVVLDLLAIVLTNNTKASGLLFLAYAVLKCAAY